MQYTRNHLCMHYSQQCGHRIPCTQTRNLTPAQSVWRATVLGRQNCWSKPRKMSSFLYSYHHTFTLPASTFPPQVANVKGGVGIRNSEQGTPALGRRAASQLEESSLHFLHPAPYELPLCHAMPPISIRVRGCVQRAGIAVPEKSCQKNIHVYLKRTHFKIKDIINPKKALGQGINWEILELFEFFNNNQSALTPFNLLSPVPGTVQGVLCCHTGHSNSEKTVDGHRVIPFTERVSTVRQRRIISCVLRLADMPVNHSRFDRPCRQEELNGEQRSTSLTVDRTGM